MAAFKNTFPVRESQKTSYDGSAAISIFALRFANPMYSLEFHILGVFNPKDCSLFLPFFQPVAPLHYFFLLKQVIINVPPFCTQPCPQISSVNCSIMNKNWKFCWTMGLISHISQNSSKFGCSSWLWWIMRGILANQKGRNSYFWKEVTWTFPQDSTRAHNWLTRLSNMASGCCFFYWIFIVFSELMVHSKFSWV